MRTLLRRLTLALLAIPAGAATLGAQDLPDADALIDRFVEEAGGAEALLAPTSMRQTGSVVIAGMGIEGTFELIEAAPNRMVMRISIPGLGEIVTGFDGEVGWTVNPLIGSMLMEGAELAQTRELADPRAAVRDLELVPTRETTEAAEYGGEPCWRVRLGWSSGRESFDCYSQETGLLLATEETQASAMGEVPVTTLYGDYRQVGDILLPSRITQSSTGQTLEITVRDFEVGSVDPSELLPPPSVQTLIQGTSGN